MIGMGAVFLTASVAYADDLKPAPQPAASAASSSDAPWFQRFTASAGLGEGLKAAPNQTNEQTITWQASNKWGLTLNLRDADRSKLVGRDEAAVGAFYHFTPRLRVGGEVSVSDSPVATVSPLTQGNEKSAGVKLESAFKF
jgi:hypothetical protein